MADEHKVDRSYHEALRRIGVKNPGEVRVGVPVELQAQVDDFSHLQPPVAVPVAATGIFVAGVAVNRSVFCEWEIRSPGGAWLIWAHSSNTQDAIIYTSAATLITGGLVVITPRFVFPFDPATHAGGALASIARAGTYNGAAIDGLRINGGGVWATPVWIERGAFVGMMTNNQVVDGVGSVGIQEVP